ncbi:serine hydrolase domain-containing protein [Polaromonas sp.]|uniref:serine hydrolase domain-containing protein n=1 Tax=Polaromonas sp. TaxID=1869339 RepID=UPI003C9C351B
MKRRSFTAATAAAIFFPRIAFTAAADWQQRFGYPTGWGPGRMWTDKAYRVGNYSGGYEAMFRARPITASAQAAPLQMVSAGGAREFAPVAELAAEYLKAWPVTGLLIARKGTILYESYQFDRKPEMRLTSWSMAKSVTSLLLGICLDRGLIRSMEDTPQMYVDELQGTLHGGVSLRNLANMSSGAAILHDRDNPTIYPRAFTGSNADLEPVVRGWNTVQEPPGTRYNYNELCPLTIGMVIRKVTGKPLAAFCEEALWQPLGAEAGATWLCDTKGKEFNCIGFAACLRDWARLGQMIAQNGMMEGRQVVSSKWIEDCSSWSGADAQGRHGTAMRYAGYKYFFWHPRPDGSLMMMNGHDGQRVLVDRRTQTVLVQTAVDSEGPWPPQMYKLFDAAAKVAVSVT